MKNFKFLIFLVFYLIYLSPSDLYGWQNTKFNSVDTTLASFYFQKVLNFQEITTIDSAIFFNKRAIATLQIIDTIPSSLIKKSFTYDQNLFELYKKKRAFELGEPHLDKMLKSYKDSSQLAYIYTNKAYIYEIHQDYPNSLNFYKKAETTDPNIKQNGRTLYGLSRVLLRQGKYRLAQEYFAKSVPILDQDSTVTPSYLASLYLNAGVSYGYDGFYQKAMYYYQKCFELAKEKLGKDNPYYSYSLINFGAVAEKLGNYSKALEYYQAANVILRETEGNVHSDVAVTHNNIGVIYELLEQFQAAELEYKKSIAILNQLEEENLADMVDYRLNLGKVYAKMGRCEDAIAILLPNLKILKQVLGDNHPGIAKTLGSIADCYEKLGLSEKAENLHQEAVDFLSQNLGEQHPDLSLALNKLGAILFKNGQTEAALATFQKSLWIHDKSCDTTTIFSNPKNLEVLEPMTLLETMDSKAIHLKKAFEKDPSNLKLLETAYQTYLPVLELEQQIFKSFDREASKLNLLKQIVAINTRAVEVAYTLYQNQPNSELEANLFLFIENARASVLQEALFIKAAKLNQHIPESIVLDGRELKTRINELKYQRIEKEIDELAMNQINTELLQLNLQYDSLWSSVAKDFPAYQLALDKKQNISLKNIKANLKSDETILVYFLSDSTLYNMAISRENIAIKAIPLDFPLKQWIYQFQQSLFQYHLSEQQTAIAFQNNLKDITKYGHQLYQALIEPLGTLTKKLIIVPDGELGYIPFDALLATAPNPKVFFMDWDFLIKKHQISYSYAMQIWLDTKNKPQHKGRLLAFAPTFAEVLPQYTNIDQLRGEGLGKLTFNETEANQIVKIMGGTTFIGEAANLANFYENAPTASILHFATHAKLDDDNINYSWLALQPTFDTLKKDKIFIKDLYNLHLSTEMVVLSACETGYGTLKKGEGVFSLARGFTYAGAKSIITSLWSVNDKSTFSLMQNFYQNLKEGQSKDAALRKAKIAYIKSVDNYQAHPFYWASFIGIGNMSPLALKQDYTFTYFLLFASILFLIGLIFYFRQ